MRGAGGEGAPLTTLFFQGGSPRGRFAGSPQGAAPARSAPLKKERRGAPSPPTLPPHNHSLLCVALRGKAAALTGPRNQHALRARLVYAAPFGLAAGTGATPPQNDKKKARPTNEPHQNTRG